MLRSPFNYVAQPPTREKLQVTGGGTRVRAGIGGTARPEDNDEGMTHATLSIARPEGRFIDRWLRWQDQREARRREQWEHHMHQDQRFGIW